MPWIMSMIATCYNPTTQSFTWPYPRASWYLNSRLISYMKTVYHAYNLWQKPYEEWDYLDHQADKGYRALIKEYRECRPPSTSPLKPTTKGEAS